jgi:hypothetical protein
MPTPAGETDVILSASLLMSVVLSQSTAPAQAPEATPSPLEWVVVVAAPVYLPDGGIRSETSALPTAGAGLVHLFSRKTLCAPAASTAVEPTDAAFGWRVASQIVARSAAEVVVSLDWRRVWDAGKRVNNGPGGTVQLTLHPGDRIPLDHIANASPSSECRAVGLGLEVKLARIAPPAPPPPPSALPLGVKAGGARPVDAELWLTHTSPVGTEQVSHQVVRLPEVGGRFSFTHTSLATARGEYNVELAGTIDRFRSPTGGEFLVLSMNRHVSGANLPTTGVTATTGTIVPMPATDEVLAFELSPSRRARGGGGGGAGGRGSGGTEVARASPGGAAAGPVVQARQGGGPRGGGGGGLRTAAATPATGTNLAQIAAMLEGHQFSLKMRMTPVN